MNITINETWKKFIVEYDAHRSLYIAWAIASLRDEPYWFKGTGKTQIQATEALTEAVAEGRHVGEPLRPSRYVRGAFREATIPPERLSSIDLSTLDFKL